MNKRDQAWDIIEYTEEKNIYIQPIYKTMISKSKICKLDFKLKNIE